MDFGFSCFGVEDFCSFFIMSSIVFAVSHSSFVVMIGILYFSWVESMKPLIAFVLILLIVLFL